MPRYTAAYSNFLECTKEIKLLIKTAKSFGIKNPDTVNALCRGSVVLLCSHLEGYMEEIATIITERISAQKIKKNIIGDAFKYHNSKDFLSTIEETQNPNAKAQRLLALMQRDDHIWDSTDHYYKPLNTDIIIGDFATPKYDNCRRLIKKFGYITYHNDFNAHLKGQAVIVRNMIDAVVNTRNDIAHGDNSVKPTPSEVQNMEELTKTFCRTTDIIVCAYFKSKKCSLR